MAGIVNVHEVRSMKSMIKAENEFIRKESLRTIEAGRARALQDLQSATRKYMQDVEDFRSGAKKALDTELANYKDEMDEELQEMDNQVDEEHIQYVKDNFTDPGGTMLIEKGKNKQRDANLLELYDTTPALPIRVMNTIYPGKRTIQNSTLDNFGNTLQRAWHYFVKWFIKTGWKMLLQVAIDVILAFIPGVGTMLGMMIDAGVSTLIDVIDMAKTSAEQVALERAINEGRSRGLDSYDEMFMWRSLIIIMMVSLADTMELTIDGNQLKALTLNQKVFQKYMKDNQFVQDMWACESKMLEALAGEDPTTHEPDFQWMPEDVNECRSMALKIVNNVQKNGFVVGKGKHPASKLFVDMLKK